MIWLIGNKGMLGSQLEVLLRERGIAYIASDRNCDITSMDCLRSFALHAAGEKRITRVINCAAYTAVDKAEEEEKPAQRLNADGAAHIACVARELGASLIHISTDYVFDGNAASPYTEDMPVCPASVYGKTKAQGEELVLRHCPRSFIVRTAWLYGRYGNNFVSTMLRLMNEKPSLKVVDDQRGTPTNAHDLARALFCILSSSDGDIPFGIYHFTNTGETSWYGFATEIYRLGKDRGLIRNDCTVLPCTTEEYPTKAKRPPYSVLSKEKIQSCLDFTIPDWKESLEGFISHG